MFFLSLSFLPQNCLRKGMNILIEAINFEIILYTLALTSWFEAADEAFTCLFCADLLVCYL
jgi:hypothetical protein